MNYRHAYHAGNHADILKHTVLALVLQHLRKKEKPFRVIDAHAGIAKYDLTGLEASKTGEWRTGIGKMADPFTPEVEALLKPWRSAVTAASPFYPGSPGLIAHLLRPQDRLIANELHPEDHARLAEFFATDHRVKVTSLDAQVCVKANLPPPERRGLVLLDPPYEERDEAETVVRALAQGHRRFATGIFVLWYPLKADGLAERLCDQVAALGLVGTLKAQLQIRESFREGGLAGSGLLIVNPPWQLDEELHVLVPALARRLGLGNWGQATIEWLMPPK
jgi:23S rRNA (adenine2030-N6)-methyltransferase